VQDTEPLQAAPKPRTKCARCHNTIATGAFRMPVSVGSDSFHCRTCFTFLTGVDAKGNPIAATVSTDILRDELRKREQAITDAERQRKNEDADRIMQHIDALLLLVPKHSRTSCSDSNFDQNAYQARCTRCVLLEAERDGFWRNDIDLCISAQYDAKHASI